MGVPDAWKRSIIKLPKKSKHSDCHNWRVITLLSTPGKVFTSVAQQITNAVDQTLRDEQAGFRKVCSCPEQIFALRSIIYNRAWVSEEAGERATFAKTHKKEESDGARWRQQRLTASAGETMLPIVLQATRRRIYKS